jgi:hypothetical protein
MGPAGEIAGQARADEEEKEQLACRKTTGAALPSREDGPSSLVNGLLSY